VTFDQGHITENAGLLLLHELDRREGLTRDLAAALHDWRDPRFIVHSLEDLVRSRVFAIAQGYEDCNDMALLRDEPLFKVACERGARGVPLPSQPSLSRFEKKALRLTDLDSVRPVLVRNAVARWKRLRQPPRELILDLDSTADPTHGQQEFAEFNGFYDTYCYQQILVFTQEGDLLWSKLVSGRANARLWGLKGVTEVVTEVRAAFPNVHLKLRADSGFATPELYDWCEEHDVGYVINGGTHRVYCEQTRHLLERAEDLFKAADEQAPVQVFGEFLHQAKTWRQPRRVIAKAQRTLVGPDQRFLVTNLALTPGDVFAFYAEHGQMENRIKDAKLDIKSDRLSASQFIANELRLLLYSLAYQLLHLLRSSAPEPLKAARLSTVRQQLLRVAAIVKQTARRLWVKVSEHFPWRAHWVATAQALTN
jgi:hypothetical protein